MRGAVKTGVGGKADTGTRGQAKSAEGGRGTGDWEGVEGGEGVAEGRVDRRAGEWTGGQDVRGACMNATASADAAGGTAKSSQPPATPPSPIRQALPLPSRTAVRIATAILPLRQSRRPSAMQSHLRHTPVFPHATIPSLRHAAPHLHGTATCTPFPGALAHEPRMHSNAWPVCI
jgi:hypothetical protein